jgi:hypothetical protein
MRRFQSFVEHVGFSATHLLNVVLESTMRLRLNGATGLKLILKRGMDGLLVAVGELEAEEEAVKQMVGDVMS